MALSIKAQMVMAAVAATKGKMFSVTHKRKKAKVTIKHKVTGEKITEAAFRKVPDTLADNYIRTVEEYNSMTVRTEVKKHLAGGDSTIEHKKADGLISVFRTATPSQLKDKTEEEKKRLTGYRAFYADDVKSITIQGVTTNFDNV